MRAIVLALLLAATGCTTVAYHDPRAFWGRPGARLPELAAEAEACYQASVDAESPSALAVGSGAPRLLPRTEPPPRLWERAPSQVALEHFDEEMRYDQCMRERGWRPIRVVSPAR